MDLHQSANRVWNLYRAYARWHLDQDWNIEPWEAEYVYRYIRVAHLRCLSFEFSHCDQVTQVAFRASVVPIVVEVHPCLCASTVCVDSLVCQFAEHDSRPFDFPKPLLGVILSQPSPCYSRRTQRCAILHLELWHVVSWLVVVFAQLRCTKTLFQPFWRYSKQDASRTV